MDLCPNVFVKGGTAIHWLNFESVKKPTSTGEGKWEIGTKKNNEGDIREKQIVNSDWQIAEELRKWKVRGEIGKEFAACQ